MMGIMGRIPAKITVRRRSTGDMLGDEKTLIIDPEDREDLDGILLKAVKADGWDLERIGEFELTIDPLGGKRFTHPPEQAKEDRENAA